MERELWTGSRWWWVSVLCDWGSLMVGLGVRFPDPPAIRVGCGPVGAEWVLGLGPLLVEIETGRQQ